MAKYKALNIAVASLLAVLLAGSGIYLLWSLSRRGMQAERLQEQVSTLTEEKTALQAREEELQNEIAALQEENRALREGTEIPPPTVISRKPKDGWEELFPTPATTTLLNEPVEDVRNALGEPPYLIRSIAVNPQYNREIWIYVPYDEDPTGLYLFFKGNRLTESRLDEFNGLHNSGLLDDEDFWLN
jgi:hypothetical protein